MKIKIICSLAVIFGSTPADAFAGILQLINKVNPSIKKFAEAQDNALLKIHLDIGKSDWDGNAQPIGNRLGVDGLLLEMHGNEDAKYKHPKLPGADGPNPQLSTGAKTINVLRPGKYVDITGSKQVKLDNGVWEIIWRQNALAGSLICGFDVPEEVKRNDAGLDKGRVYISFPVWTTESLQDLRERKAKAEEKAVDAIERQQEAVRKMEETSNPLMKALHFREACKANEDLDYSGHRSYKSMPLERDMIPLKGGLNLCSLGTVWTKKDGILGFGGDHILLGSASASAGVREELMEKKTVTERELKSVAFDGLRP